MKKLIYIIALIITVLTFTSCEKETFEPETPGIEDTVVTPTDEVVDFDLYNYATTTNFYVGMDDSVVNDTTYTITDIVDSVYNHVDYEYYDIQRPTVHLVVYNINTIYDSNVYGDVCVSITNETLVSIHITTDELNENGWIVEKIYVYENDKFDSYGEEWFDENGIQVGGFTDGSYGE